MAGQRGRRVARVGQSAAAKGRGRVFFTGRSQAIRIPKAFRLAVAEVSIRRQGSLLVLEPIERETDAMGWPRAFWDLAGSAPEFEAGDRHERHDRGDVLARARSR